MTQSQQRVERAQAEAEEEKKQTELGQTYYLRIARRIRIVMIALVFVLAAFLVFMLSRYRSEITVENLKYFLRYIDTRQAEKSATTDVIVYDDIDSIVQFGVFKNSIAVVGYDQAQLYDLTGEATLNVSKVNAQPTLLCSDKYMMVYNVGGTTFQLYNSLSCVYEESYDFGIGVAALGDTGRFLISSRSIEYRSVVNVYDKDFEPIYRWYTPDKLVMAADFANGDSEFLIAALGNRDDGSFYTEILLCETDKEEKKLDFVLNDEIIYKARYTEDGGFILIGGKAVYFYDKDGALTTEVTYGGYTPVNVDTDGDMTYFVVNQNVVGSNYHITVMDKNGKLLYQNPIYGEITKVLTHGNAVYVLLDRSVVRIAMETGNQIEKEVPTNAITLLSLDEGSLALCYAGETQVLNIDSFFFDS